MRHADRCSHVGLAVAWAAECRSTISQVIWCEIVPPAYAQVHDVNHESLWLSCAVPANLYGDTKGTTQGVYSVYLSRSGRYLCMREDQIDIMGGQSLLGGALARFSVQR